MTDQLQEEWQAEPPGDHFVGPFKSEYYKFVVDGCVIPKLRGTLDKDGNTWHLVFDDRFGWDCTDQELQNWLYPFAQACAVSAGFSHFGKDSAPRNPFHTQIFGLTPPDPNMLDSNKDLPDDDR